MAQTSTQIKDFHFENLFTADQFFELSADHKTLSIVTPAPTGGTATGAFALSAGQCAFKDSGAPGYMVNNLSIPRQGEQQTSWIGLGGDVGGTWQGDDPATGFRASVTVH